MLFKDEVAMILSFDLTVGLTHCNLRMGLTHCIIVLQCNCNLVQKSTRLLLPVNLSIETATQLLCDKESQATEAWHCAIHILVSEGYFHYFHSEPTQLKLIYLLYYSYFSAVHCLGAD